MFVTSQARRAVGGSSRRQQTVAIGNGPDRLPVSATQDQPARRTSSTAITGDTAGGLPWGAETQGNQLATVVMVTASVATMQWRY